MAAVTCLIITVHALHVDDLRDLLLQIAGSYPQEKGGGGRGAGVSCSADILRFKPHTKIIVAEDSHK